MAAQVSSSSYLTRNRISLGPFRPPPGNEKGVALAITQLAAIISYFLENLWGITERMLSLLSVNASLDITLVAQERDKWCYAAVAVSIAKYYDEKSDWAQCMLASENLSDVEKKTSKNYCCDNPEDEDCNTEGFIYNIDTQQGALVTTKNFGQWIKGPAEALPIYVEIRSGRPVIALHRYKIQVDPDNVVELGHFTVISKYDHMWQAELMLYIQDPWDKLGFKDNSISYEKFKTYWAYDGIWTYTYFTKSSKQAKV
jgi:hypothetical protein